MSFTREYKQQMRYTVLASAILVALFSGADSARAAEEAEFDASFLQVGKGETIDLSRFNEGASATPGTYRTLVYVNDHLIANENITFREWTDKRVRACIPSAMLKKIPFNSSALPASAKDLLTTETDCSALEVALPDASVSYDSNQLRLDISIPQIYLNSVPRDYVDPALWDEGIPALMLGYSTNAYTSRSSGQVYKSFFGGVNAGLNVGGWYLRHNGNYNWQQQGGSSYQALNTYVQHDVVPLRGRVVVGQSNTSGVIFDTLPFSGVQLASDERMLPESQRGYAPEIRGIARTNARLTVSQQGQVIYETTVPPGEFLINDLYPTGYGGDLEVTVNEADGSKSSFRVPYAAVAQLLRPGTSRYDFTAGKLRSDYLRDDPALLQGTWQYGLTNAVTGYAGLQTSQNYYAVQGGAALGTPVGAFAFDITQARTHLSDNEHNNASMSGQSYRVSYSEALPETGSNLSIAAYRFSTAGFMDFMTAMQSRDALQRGDGLDSVYRAKNRFSVTAGQSLPDVWGNFYLSGSVQDYWNRQGNEKQFQFGYNNRTGTVSWGISVNRSYSSYGTTQNSYLLSFSLPLGSENLQHTPQLRTELSHDNGGRWGQQATLSGTAGDNSQFSYGATARHASPNEGTSESLNAQYRASATNLSGSVSSGKGYQSGSLGLNGTIVAHSGGVTLSPYSGDTYALVEAKGAQGASVSSYPGVYVDGNGYALVPYLNPYQMNEIVLDPKGTSAGVELENTSSRVAPYSGAVVKVKYNAHRGLPVLITASWQGKPLPFGADVLDSKGNVVGSVGQAGQAYALVEEPQGRLTVRWGNEADQSCSLPYQRMPEAKNSKPALQTFNAVCGR
jgi:outer membrane usher protein